MRTALLMTAVVALAMTALPCPTLAGEPELVTDQEIAELKQIAEQARAGTLPGMMPKAEVERLRHALKQNPRTKEEAKLAEYRRQALQDWESLEHGGEAQANRLRNGGVSQAELRQIRKNLTEYPVRVAASRRRLDVAEGRITRASVEAEIAAAKKALAELEAKLAAVPKEAETALNPERYRQEQTAKIGADLAAGREKLTAAETKLAAVDEVSGKPAADF